MAIKYFAIDSTGLGFDIGETRTVDVTNEALSLPSGFESDVIVYTAIVEDEIGEALPVTFCAELKGDGLLLASVAFQSSVYDQVTHILTLDFLVPDVPGSYVVKLTSVDQII